MGRFELSDIPLGIYKLTVSYIGYAKEERHSSISNEDDSLYFEVNLHIPDIKIDM
ncbi:carboxypeptidase-like regulatory domain-containing protein [candidate division KSB1 bacterium]|nr:carboxypeptidase-like regulatory domain-containing protein [candidate division KSB1 bacterium]NIR68600.1 carboxypeptidase-like regulatory domain-containing protein [candidate division KSB1 bacterium]NIS25437.1 carboxypeptidase-like regulatory domain-containing protein [candidate division KSB1 bacterium]NIT72329.1 carboxypeptidase-like regulatory domain-containing protein [candidate division KSB1 bacterium]NIU26113.1 carboxypeptidase-like regulatory domain-containing protein [candidate divisi